MPQIPQLPPGIGPQNSQGIPGPQPPQGTAPNPLSQSGQPAQNPLPNQASQANQSQAPPARIGPDLAKLPTSPDGAPPIPELPKIAENLPQSLPQQAPTPPGMQGMNGMSGMAGLTQMTQMPRMPGRSPRHSASLTLQKGSETKELHGLACTQYTLSIPREGKLILWLTPEENLFPFHRLTFHEPNQFGRTEWPDQVATLLRSQKLFPLLLTLHEEPHSREETPEPSPEILRWEVTSIKKAPLPNKDPKKELFTTPESFKIKNN